MGKRELGKYQELERVFGGKKWSNKEGEVKGVYSRYGRLYGEKQGNYRRFSEGMGIKRRNIEK